MATSTADEPKLPGGYLVTPRVPQGLAAAVEGLTREVIRHSPEDIYVFAAHHFEKLLVLREQCGGVEKVPERDSNLRALREMSQALKMREADRGNARIGRSNVVDQAGWSLNQTAKVLKRHRSIFGEAGRRISTDEVFRMANQKENHGRSPKSSADKTGSRGNNLKKQTSSEDNVDNLWKASTSRTERSCSNEDSADTNSETRSGPRIITQIPSLQSGAGMLAKDIKTELRKNRISSRERRNLRAKPEDRSAIDRAGDKPSTKHFSSRKTSDKHKRIETEIELKRSHANLESSRSSKDRQDRRSDSERSSYKNGGSSESRALSMDRVKDYVVQRFATTKSLEELQSVNYVEKVQEIIDETGPIIKGKVDELKSGMIGRSKRSSWFANARNDRVKGSDGSESNRDNRSSGEYASPKDSTDDRGSRVPTSDALKSRLTETQNLLENVSSSLTRPRRRSRSARSSRRLKNSALSQEDFLNLKDSREEIPASISDPSDRTNGLERKLSNTRNLLEDISSALSRPMRRSYSAKALRKCDDLATDDSSDFGTKSDALKTRLDETRNLLKGLSATLAMPGRRVRSAKGSRHRASVDASPNSEDFDLADSQIRVSKVSLPAVRSNSIKSSPGSVSRSDSNNLVLPAISPEAPKSAKIKEDLVLPVLSPPGTGSSNQFEEIDIPEIPVEDYIPEALVEDVFRDSLNVTPNFDSIPQRPDSLEPEETPENVQEEKVQQVNDLEGRLQEIQKVEKDIEEIFVTKSSNNPETPESVENSNIKKKLQELEEAEKRIDRIFETEVCNEGKDTPTSEKEVELPVEIVDESADCGGAVGEETRIERAVPIGAEENEGNGQTRMEGEENKMDKLSSGSPESLNYTYVLTEGSPYDIPDTVTTVIIPERPIETPESSSVCVESKDCLEEKLSSPPETAESKASIEEVAEMVAVEDLVKTDAADDTTPEDSKELDSKSSSANHEDVEEKKEATEQLSKNSDQSNDEESSTPKVQSDLFGEFVQPEMLKSTSADIDFIRGIETRHDIQIPHKDLGPINEEMSEELECIEEREDGVKVSKTIETIEESKEDTLDEDVESKEDDVDKEVIGDDVEVDKSKEITESDLSPVASRPEVDSESSNEAKESSAADEPLESAKCGGSLEEEVSSETRSPESSNEVKETTLTDGLSLSLDPMRPYVPELNLDSLQDITVSSFKMTEDEYDNQGKAESENTNSITDTLTSDENRRIIDNTEFAEEAIIEFLQSSSDRSKLDEKHEELADVQEDVVEETIVKSQVEVKEDVCEKTSTYVTGPSNEEEKIGNAVIESSTEVKENNLKDDQDREEIADADIKISEVEEQVQLEEGKEVVINEAKKEVKQDLKDNVESQNSIEENTLKSEKIEEEASTGHSENEEKEAAEPQTSVENENSEVEVTKEEANKSQSGDEGKEVAELRISVGDENSEVDVTKEEANKSQSGDEGKEVAELQISVGDENSEDLVTKEEHAESTEVGDGGKEAEEPETPTENENIEVKVTKEDAIRSQSGDEEKRAADPQNSIEQENDIIEAETENSQKDKPNEIEPNDVKLETSELQREEEETNKDVLESASLNESANEVIIKNVSNKVEEQSLDETNKSVELDGAPKSGEDGSDEILEESLVEEDTPLAVSRSASQCTTRRVSSGNLARLREDPSLGWTEEVGPEADDEEDQISTKVKFSKIGGETIKEQGSDEIDLSPGPGTPQNDSNQIDESLTKDSKEYHIYVPDVDAAEDNSTSESSTVESAVTKIQAGVRGFLTRRRLLRGQHNRSSTLGSIPSIQDSIAVDPEKEEMGISSPPASELHGLENAATRIQNNYRRYKARNRLRREDAVQRTTLSLEKSFAESGLQHTGEFHDCVPLPIHDLAVEKKSSMPRTASKSRSTSGSISSPSETGRTSNSDSNSTNSTQNSDKVDEEISSSKTQQSSPGEDLTKNYLQEKGENSSTSQSLGKMFFGQPSNVPIIQFGTSPNIAQLVDLVVLAKEEAALQSGYLNFITSVEDADQVDASSSAVPMNLKDFTEGETHSNESFKEPLALSLTPVGVVIEEVTTSGAENFMKSDDLDPTIVSTDSSVVPEVATQSSDSPRAPCASSEAVSASMDDPEAKDSVSDDSEVQGAESESSKIVDKIAEHPRQSFDDGTETLVASEQTTPHSSSEKMIEENLALPTESTLQDFVVSEKFSLPHEKGLLGPESSVDSMECPVAVNEDKNSSRSSEDRAETSAVTSTVAELSTQEAAKSQPEELKEETPKDEEPSCSIADESSSMLSFSMKVQDFLGLGSEDAVELRGRKPILEVTLTPGDLMKSMSLSQESQLAGERIESPITMVQMAPARSESLQQEDLSENGCEESETNGQRTLHSSSTKSDKNTDT